MTPEPTALEWVLLRLIEVGPKLDNDYRLHRLFMGTEACTDFWQSLRDLVAKGWVSVEDPKAQVKQYFTREAGRRLLSEGYSTAKVKDYLISIDPRGLILHLLELRDGKVPDEPDIQD
jgi:hypothetical protein